MPPDTLNFFFLLAQSPESSDVTDLASQISGLLLGVCGLGVIWLVLMAMIFRRAATRRERAKHGQEPLPAFYVQFFHWLKKQLEPEGSPGKSAAAPAAAAAPRVRPTAPRVLMPSPDLSDLVSLPTPALDELVTRPAAPPARPQPVIEEEVIESDEYEEVYPDDAVSSIVEPAGGGYADDDADEGIADEPIEPPAAAQAVAPVPPDSVELMRVYRDLTDGSLIVEIGGQQFSSLDGLRGADLERRFKSVVNDLGSLAGASARPATRSPHPAPTPAQRKKSAVLPPDELDTAAVPSMSPSTMLRQMTRVAMGQKPEQIEQTPILSVADEIEQLLQKRLANMPEFSERDIHVRPSATGGVEIIADGVTYDGVESVSDQAVRDLLGDVVREWEAR